MSSVHNIYEFGQAWWAEARKKVKNAAVFLDSVTCECLHWNGGAPSLFDAGAICIKELSTFEVVPKDVKKAVFISSTVFHGTNYKILESLIKNSNLEYCIIIISAHVSVQHLLQWGGGREGNELETLDKIEEDVLNWMGNLNYTVEVFSYPLSTVHPTKDTILIPSASLAESFFPNDLDYLNEQLHLFGKTETTVLRSVNDLTFAYLPIESQVLVRQLTHNLNHLLQHINGKDEIFTIGSYSRIVGTELEALNIARSRRKTASNKVSVILVDRILDLATATKCSSESLFDRLIQTLDRLHDCSNDVAVNITGKRDELTVSPGCIAPQTNWTEGWRIMDYLFHCEAEVAIEHITEEVRDAHGDSRDLTTIIEECNNNWDFIEKFTHLYQVGSAVEKVEKHPKAKHMDSLEKIRLSLVEMLSSDSASPLVQILKLLKTRKDLNLSLDDILVLCVHLYSLAGDEKEVLLPSELEDRLKSQLTEILVDDFDNLSDKLQNFVGFPVDEVRAHLAAQKIVEQLNYVSDARCWLKKYPNLHRRLNPAMPFECISFLQQLIDDIFDPSLTDIPDLEHKSGGLKDLLKSGFSLFVNVRKPRPTDNPTILFYVCGGIRSDEVKLIRNLVRQKSPTHKVLIASSHIIAAHDALRYVIRKNHV